MCAWGVPFALDTRPIRRQNSNMSKPLEKELETFHRELPQLLANPENHGKAVLIRGETVEGIYLTQHDAITAGYERFGLVQFLAKKILEQEEHYYFSRNLTPCH